MKPLLSLLPPAGLLAAAALGLSAMISTTALAAACKIDNGGGCEREGMKCDPPQGGKCVTGRIGTRELTCTCQASSRSPRGDRPPIQSHPGDQPGGQPQEPTEPQEPGPGGRHN